MNYQMMAADTPGMISRIVIEFIQKLIGFLLMEKGWTACRIAGQDTYQRV